MTPQACSIIKEIVFTVHHVEIEEGVLSSSYDFIPQYNLVELVGISGVLSCKVQEELLHVPVEQGLQVRFQVELQEAHIVLRTHSSEIPDILDNLFADTILYTGIVLR